MPSPWKYHPHGSVLFVTFSLEAGLLLLANPLSEAIVKCCLARAQTLHPVTISHFIVEGSHLHLILVVENPHDVQAFIGRFKTESAHMLNRLLGRRKQNLARRRARGRDKLISRPLDPDYQSQRSGKRMWCLAEKRSIRVRIINSLKALIERARAVYQKWFVGDFSERYPLGLYPPSMPKLAEPLGI